MTGTGGAGAEGWVREADPDAERTARTASDFLADRDRTGRTLDFHSLRHTFITNRVNAGAQPEDAKELARPLPRRVAPGGTG